MKLCQDTITVFNKRHSDGSYVYIPTIIKGVSWYGTVDTNVGDKGLMAASHFTVRIPIDADFGGKTYVDSNTYANETLITGLFTFAQGDIIVKAEVDTSMSPAALKEAYIDYCTILGVTDNRRAPNAPHWRITGR